MLSLIRRAQKYSRNIAIISDGKSYLYDELLEASVLFGKLLLTRESDLRERRIGFIIEPGFDYVKVQWAIWRAGGIAVPLNPKAPARSLEYVMKDANLSLLVTSPNLMDTYVTIAAELGIAIVSSDAMFDGNADLPDIDEGRRAMILYTSGTTGSPKGVVTTHANIKAQITTLVSYWHWSQDDHIINVLPLDHVHGIVNVLSCAFWSGATCEFATFDDKKLLNRLVAEEVNLFMAVPTIYFKLITYWESLTRFEQEQTSRGLKKMRLMVSGSAALPVSVLEKWQTISGHTLLERYGMTEIGMAISNSYEGKRIPGHIGHSLPGVKVRIVDENMSDVDVGTQGEILVKGPTVFKEYWNKPTETNEAFTSSGWFRTGDVAINDNGSYKLLGRSSIDIIKSGGYKLSALEIEEVLRHYPTIKDCGVVGIPNKEWGETVAVGLVVEGEDFIEADLKEWMSERLEIYKIPKIIKIIDELPRNAMGKVVKMELKKQLNPNK